MSHKQERQFGFLFAAVFTIVAFWPLWPLTAPNLYWLGGAGAWLLAALVVPRALAPLNRGWIAFGHVLGWINARIILGLVFFVVVTPTGLIMRLLGKDLLRMRSPRSASYWIKRDQPLDPQSLRNQF
ncbi:MAG: SxtJ family membrane protein [Chromatiales bacterium]|nr:SxtJ family membrane protein [Chromatiales bacterium]